MARGEGGKSRVASGQVARRPLARVPPVWEERAKRVSESFVLRTYIVGRTGVKKLFTE